MADLRTSPFDLSVDELKRLSPGAAVELFRNLLWAEANKLGISKNLVNVPSSITVSDGGIDAEVKLGHESDESQLTNLIRPGRSSFQIKTGPFSPTAESNIEDLLCAPKKKGDTKRTLNTRVKSCLEEGGTFWIVLFGWDDPDHKDNEIRDKFISFLKSMDGKYEAAKIEILRANQIVGCLRDYPALIARAKFGNVGPLYSHDAWSKWGDMKNTWVAGPDQETFVAAIRDSLRDSAGSPIQIIAEPGIGKTFGALIALGPPDLSAVTLYSDRPDDILRGDLAHQLLHGDSCERLILVVDECDAQSRSDLYNRFKNLAPKVRLITIDSDRASFVGGSNLLIPSALPDEQVAQILAEYGVPKSEMQQWVGFCSGSPRVAHVLGMNLRDNPDDFYKSPTTVPIWERYVAGGHSRTSEEFKKRKRVLMYIALFLRFGYAPPYEQEAKLIAKMIGISWIEFQELIKEFRQSKILQGESTLFITPHLLHIWLWNEWWQTFGTHFNLSTFKVVDPSTDPPTVMSDRLLAWFFAMYKYADSVGGNRVVRELLGPEGPFDLRYLGTQEGGDFFTALAQADAAGALECLERLLGHLDSGELKAETAARRTVVNTLAAAAMRKELFLRSARMLKKLALAENETWANNATGVFRDLFSLSIGEGAPTEASAEERWPLIEEALASGNESEQLLALSALDHSLTRNGTVRLLRTQWFGIPRKLALWHPATYGEWFDAYRYAWRTAVGFCNSESEVLRNAALKTILNHTRSWAGQANLADMVVTDLSSLSESPLVDAKSILAVVESVIYYDLKDLPEAVRPSWLELRSKLIGTSFGSRLSRYAGMNLLTDRFNARREHEDQTLPRLMELAEEAIAEPGLLMAELGWLTTSEAANGYAFGRELALRDSGLRLIQPILDALAVSKKNASAFFAAGYLSVLHDKDIEKWEKIMDEAAANRDLRDYVAELSWRSGQLTDRAAARILDLAREGYVQTAAFRMFTFGRASEGISEPVFSDWVRFLLGSSEPSAVDIALDLFEMFYIDKDARLPRELTREILLHPSLFSDEQVGTMAEYNWNALALRFVAQYPDEAVPIAREFIANMGTRGGIAGGFRVGPDSFISGMAKQFPEELWKIVAGFLGPPIDDRAFAITSWLRTDDTFDENGFGALSCFRPKDVWDWVDADIENRAWYLASFSPKALFRRENEVCWAREILARYGNREDVRNQMTSNFFTGGWTGPTSLYYQGLADDVRKFKESETNTNVLRWLGDVLYSLEKSAERARAEEERGDY